MSQPVTDLDDLPDADVVTVPDDASLPDGFEDVPEPLTDEEEVPTAPGIEDVDDLPDVPGGDFRYRRAITVTEVTR